MSVWHCVCDCVCDSRRQNTILSFANGNAMEMSTNTIVSKSNAQNKHIGIKLIPFYTRDYIIPETINPHLI